MTRIPRASILAVAAGAALLAGVSAGRPVRQEPAEQALLERYTRMLKDAERYRSEKKYDFAANTLADLIEGAVKNSRPGSPVDEVGRRASVVLADLGVEVADEADVLDRRIGILRDEAVRMDTSRVKRAEKLLSALREIPRDPSSVISPTLTKLNELRAACGAVGLARMSDDERAEVEGLAGGIETLRESACATTDPGDAGRSVAGAEQSLSLLEKAASEARTWQGLKALDPADGGIDDGLPDRLRKNLDAVEDKLEVWKAAAADLATFGPSLARDAERIDAVLTEAARLLEGMMMLFRAHRTIDKAYGPRTPQEFPWFESASIATDPIRSVHLMFERVPGPADLDDVLGRPAKVETLVKGLRDDCDTLEGRIEATDRTARTCLAALEGARNDVAKANICLRTVRVRAQRAAGSIRPQKPDATGTAPGAPDKGSGTTNMPSNAPDQPPAAPPTPPAPQAQATLSPVPPVKDDVFGGLQIQGGSNNIPVGGSARFVATDMGNRPSPAVTWTSLNEEVLSIGADGTAGGLSEGPVTILVQLVSDPSVRAYRDVRVVASGTKAVSSATSQTQGQSAAAPPKPAGQVPAGTSTAQAAEGTTAEGTSAGFGDKGPPKVTTVAPGEDPDEGQKEHKGETDENRSLEILGQTASQDLADRDKKGPPQPGFPDESSEGFKDKGTKVRTAGGSITTNEDDLKGRASQGTGGGRTGGQTRPVIRSLSLTGTGQPAAWHIFATGSRMGWAAAYARYTGGSADQDIVDHLIMAGEHAMWANRQSSSATAEYQAWPEWSRIQSRFRSWAEQIVRGGSGGFREQIALDLESDARSMAERVTFQVVGEKVQTPNCDGAYMRLGFALAFGQTSLQLAEAAAQAGQERLADQARQDSVDHLRRAVRILSEYGHVKVVTGRCADLKDVRAEIEALLRLRDMGEQARMTIHAWTTASDRIRALADQAAPRPVGDEKEEERGAPDGESGELAGEWVFAAQLFPYMGKENVDIREGRPNKRYDDMIAGARQAIRSDRAASRHRVIIVKNGDRYTGRLAPGSYLGFPSEVWGGKYFTYRPGVEVLRLVRTGPNTYEGEYCWAKNNRFTDETVWIKTIITVKGDQFFQEMLSRSSFPDRSGPGPKNRLTWLRLPER